MSLDLTAAGPARPGPGRSRRSRGGGPQPYDFRRPTKLSREHVRSLQIVFETFARQWTTLLTSSLRVVCQVNVGSIEQQTYDEYVSTLANPTVMGILSVEPLGGAGVLEMPMSAAMSSLDHLLGGPGAGEQPQRPLSDIETVLLRQLLDRVLGELRYAFEPLVRLQPQLGSLEFNPQFAQAASAADMMIVASFEMRLGAVECVATVCLPFAGLFPVLESANGHGLSSERDRAARAAAARALAARLEAVPVEVAVRFQPVPVTPAALLDLAVGDVLPLRHPVSAPLAVTAADVTFAHAVPGAQGRRLACLVVAEPAEEAGPSGSAAAPAEEAGSSGSAAAGASRSAAAGAPRSAAGPTAPGSPYPTGPGSAAPTPATPRRPRPSHRSEYA